MIRNFAGCGNVAVEIEWHGANSTGTIGSGLACRFNALLVSESSFTHSTPVQNLESRRSPVVKRLIDCLFRRSRLTYFVFYVIFCAPGWTDSGRKQRRWKRWRQRDVSLRLYRRLAISRFARRTNGSTNILICPNLFDLVEPGRCETSARADCSIARCDRSAGKRARGSRRRHR